MKNEDKKSEDNNLSEAVLGDELFLREIYFLIYAGNI